MSGCKSCCIKGSGLKDLTSVVAGVDLAITPSFVLPASLVFPVSQTRAHTPRVDSAGLRVEPRTLVGLHCALIV